MHTYITISIIALFTEDDSKKDIIDQRGETTYNKTKVKFARTKKNKKNIKTQSKQHQDQSFTQSPAVVVIILNVANDTSVRNANLQRLQQRQRH